MTDPAAGGGAWLVLPTYNERETLPRFLDAALPVLSAADGRARVLVVDDDSPDGTGLLAEAIAARDERVQVLHHGLKSGLGRAYLAGFERALGEGAGLVLQCDSDLSHDPADLPRLMARAADVDVVLGSRYVPGGGVTDWSAPRRLLSRGGSWYARRVLGVGVRDLTGGMKCFRRRVLETLDLSGVRANGYVFQVEMTFRALRAGFTVAEVPIVFREREAGESKMTAGVALEAAWKVPALRVGAARRRRRLRER